MKMDFLPYENTLSVRGAYEEWGGLLFARRVDDRLRYLFLYLCGGSGVVSRAEALIFVHRRPRTE